MIQQRLGPLGPMPDGPEPWRDDAACRGLDTNVFFAGLGELRTHQLAKAICAKCPVREECLESALAMSPELCGVWGGTTQTERSALRRRRRRDGKSLFTGFDSVPHGRYSDP